MIITGGASSGFLVYSYLLTDPNDAILIPSPYYTMIVHHISVFTENQSVRCSLLEQDTGKFYFSVEIFEREYNEALANGLRSRMIIFINLHNPLGDVYDEMMIQPVLEFAAKKQLHVVIDEIYSLSLFANEKQFESVLNFSIVDSERTHFLWSFSKDFTLSGAHVGVMYVGTSELCSVASEFNFLLTPSRHIQAILTSLLADRTWLRSYIELNRL
ncbi:unnamed protein product [Rotaria sp. Silwood2]|nr:unnamed protein product [Rotaria sp. Silwood2]